MATPAIKTARLRALRGAQDPTLSVRMRQTRRTQEAVPKRPTQQPAPQPTQQPKAQVQPQAQQQPVAQTAPTQRIPTQPTPQSQGQQQAQLAASPLVVEALENGAVDTVRRKASELARLRAEQDYEQGLQT